MAARKRKTSRATSESAAKARSSLVLAHERLRFDPDFRWVLGGSATDEGSAGNGQPPNRSASGLWYSPTRAR